MIKNKPEAYGISSDNLLCMVQELETFVEDIHSISVVCDNDVIFSKCIQPYTEEPMQMPHSFSKSMNSIAVGIAIDEGKLHLDDLVIDYFKEYLPEEYDKRIDQLTVRNLLTMAANSCRLSTCFRGVTDSWITHYFTYKLPHDPGTVFQYDTGASYMLSSLVTKTMHKNVLALMKERVLKPMGITDIEWLESPEGNTVEVLVIDWIRIGLLSPKGVFPNSSCYYSCYTFMTVFQINNKYFIFFIIFSLFYSFLCSLFS